jgi:predicted ester cyclase
VTRDGVEAFYREYLAACNAHEFDRLGDYVSADVHVNGARQSLDAYVGGLREVVRAFPDYRWELRDLLIEGDRIAAHFIDTGTHRGDAFGVPATGRSVRTQEFAFYRLAAGRLAEVWVAADNLSLLEQIK